MIKKGCNQRSLPGKISNDISENQTEAEENSTKKSLKNKIFLRSIGLINLKTIIIFSGGKFLMLVTILLLRKCLLILYPLS